MRGKGFSPLDTVAHRDRFAPAPTPGIVYVCTDPAVTPYELSKEIRLKRLALVAAVLAVAACGKKDQGTTDSTSSMTPPPAVDSAANAAANKIDSAAKSVDSTAKAAVDTMKKAADSVKNAMKH